MQGVNSHNAFFDSFGYEDINVAVRIRMKPMGRTHRHFYRIVAIDARQPNDGRVLEDLGTYNPHEKDPKKSVTLKPERVKYWQSVGALASHRVGILLTKFMPKDEASSEPKKS
jgi:small subunit ribosomal protein S16